MFEVGVLFGRREGGFELGLGFEFESRCLFSFPSVSSIAAIIVLSGVEGAGFVVLGVEGLLWLDWWLLRWVYEVKGVDADADGGVWVWGCEENRVSKPGGRRTGVEERGVADGAVGAWWLGC